MIISDLKESEMFAEYTYPIRNVHAVIVRFCILHLTSNSIFGSDVGF